MERLMNEMYHLYVGNERAPWAVALTRALVGAALIGAAAFLTAWQFTDETKALVSAGLTPAIGHLLLRFGIEGVIDQAKQS